MTNAPDFRLDGQVALVTGAASGIGRGIALGLAGSGADVACFDLAGPGAGGGRSPRSPTAGRRARGRPRT